MSESLNFDFIGSNQSGSKVRSFSHIIAFALALMLVAKPCASVFHAGSDDAPSNIVLSVTGSETTEISAQPCGDACDQVVMARLREQSVVVPAAGSDEPDSSKATIYSLRSWPHDTVPKFAKLAGPGHSECRQRLHMICRLLL